MIFDATMPFLPAILPLFMMFRIRRFFIDYFALILRFALFA